MSRAKYVQQLAVKQLLQYYAKILPTICDFYTSVVPEFVRSLIERKMPQAATQVILASLHNYWKLPYWFDDLSQLLKRYELYEHYCEKHYALPKIDLSDMANRLTSGKDEAITMLGRADIVKHIFDHKHNDRLPDHFGQIYFELAEACIRALEQNDENKFNTVFPMFMSLSLLAANLKFVDPALDVNDEFRLHLISSVTNDLASVLGFAILYSAYFDNVKLSETALNKFDAFINQDTVNQQYLEKMIHLSNLRSFSLYASPRDMIRMKWKMAFERRAIQDGFRDEMGISRGKPHKSKVVREFLHSPSSEAKYLFFVVQVLPQLGQVDFEIDYHITSLARSLGKACDEEPE